MVRNGRLVSTVSSRDEGTGYPSGWFPARYGCMAVRNGDATAPLAHGSAEPSLDTSARTCVEDRDVMGKVTSASFVIHVIF